jgi:hypothetical protein
MTLFFFADRFWFFQVEHIIGVYQLIFKSKVVKECRDIMLLNTQDFNHFITSNPTCIPDAHKAFSWEWGNSVPNFYLKLN